MKEKTLHPTQEVHQVGDSPVFKHKQVPFMPAVLPLINWKD